MSKKLSRAKILALAEEEANFYGNPSEATTTTSPSTTTPAKNDDEFDGEAEYRAAILRRQRRIAIRTRFLLDDAGEEEEDVAVPAEEIAAEPVAEPVAGSPPPPPTMTAPVNASTGVKPGANAQPELTFFVPVAGSSPVPPPPHINVAVAEEDVVMASPLAITAHPELTFACSGVSFVPFLGTGIAAVSLSGPVTDISEDPMEIDGPEFQAIDSLGDPMEIDLLPPALARQLGRLFGLAGSTAAARISGFGLRSLRVPARKSCRLAVRSERCGALVGGCSMQAKMSVRRRSRMTSCHKVGSPSRRVSFAGCVGRKTNHL